MIFDPVVILMMYLYRSYNVGSGGFSKKLGVLNLLTVLEIAKYYLPTRWHVERTSTPSPWNVPSRLGATHLLSFEYIFSIRNLAQGLVLTVS